MKCPCTGFNGNQKKKYQIAYDPAVKMSSTSISQMYAGSPRIAVFNAPSNKRKVPIIQQLPV
jgi:hypothetical protein